MSFSITKISTILALISMTCFSISNFRKTKTEIVFLHMCSNISDFIMYLILGAKTGMASSFVNICKNDSYSKFNSNSFTVLFALFRILLFIIGFEGVTTVMFIILEIIATFILIYGTAQQFRVLTLIREGVWVAYNWLFASVIIAVITMIGFVSCMIAVITNISKVNISKKTQNVFFIYNKNKDLINKR